MTVFKTFWLIVKRYRAMIFIYTILLILFGVINTTNNDTSLDFTDSKPDVYLVIEDENIGLTKNLVDYISRQANIIDSLSVDGLDDALFYREVNYIITIPKNYRSDVLNGLSPSLVIKSTGDYQASLAEMILKRYLKTQEVLISSFRNEEELIQKINESLEHKTEVLVTSKLDSATLNQVTQYFNFASFSIMAIIIFIVSIVLSSFHDFKVSQRIYVSKMKRNTHNRYILMASFLYSLIVFVLFSILGLILFPNVLLSFRGILYFLNAFMFTFVSLSLSLLISKLVTNKEAVSGIVNVVALGSAFLCGAFVPIEYLPKSVLRIAHVLPSYWYIKGNEFLKLTEAFNKDSFLILLENFLVLLLFGVFFLFFNHQVTRLKEKKN